MAARCSCSNPVAWQQVNSRRQQIACNYRIKPSRQAGQAGQISFELGGYDRRRQLIIDPILLYSTYVGGGSSETGRSIAVDKDGNAYVTGQTNSTDFPLLGALQATKGMFGTDAFVAKLNPAGTALIYATYLGGSDAAAEEIALDAAGSAHIAGLTLSADFPLRNALQPAIAGGFDTFVAKLNPAGSALAYATYLGGSRRDAATGLAVDGAGNAYVGGSTMSDNFPVKDAAQERYGGLTDAIVAKLDANGALVYATWLGGQRDETANDLAVDANGNAYLTGTTTSPDFPTLNPLRRSEAAATCSSPSSASKPTWPSAKPPRAIRRRRTIR